MFYIIYKTTNLINGKFYIGKHQTKNLNDGYMGSGRLLKRAIKKYGSNNFRCDILCECTSEKEMNIAEKILVVTDSEMSYNLCPGGKGGWGYVNAVGLNNKNHHSVEQRKSISERQKNDLNVKRRFDDFRKLNHKKGLIKHTYFGNRGQIDKIASDLARTPEAIMKRKITYKEIGHQQGNKNSQFGTYWITNGIDNKKIRSVIPDGWHKGRC